MATREEILEKIALLDELKTRRSRRKIDTYYPNEGPLRRELYVKHMEFFKAGTKHRERLMLAANRIGKTESVGLYELTLHLTGQYPEWWTEENGFRKFKKPITAWVAGDTGKTVREILQTKLLGPINDMGTGVLPYESIIKTTKSPGVTDGIDTVYVKHRTGGTSQCTFKSYEQGRESFQGTEIYPRNCLQILHSKFACSNSIVKQQGPKSNGSAESTCRRLAPTFQSQLSYDYAKA
jgi:hypothetical protein